MPIKNKLLIVGCGRHLLNTMSHHLLRLAATEVACCVDPRLDARSHACHLLRCDTSCADISECALDDITAAIVATPPFASYGITQHLISRNIPVLVEKPPATTSVDIAALCESALTNNTRVQVGFNFRFSSAFRALLTVCRDDPPILLSSHFLSRHPASSEWGIKNPRKAWMRHNGVHLLDLIRRIVGDIPLVHFTQVTNQDGRHLTCISQESPSLISRAVMGNLTTGFSLGISATLSNGRTFEMQGVNTCVELAHHGGPILSSLYQAKELDDGWDRLGYGPELEAFLSPESAMERPSLKDALMASLQCDALFGGDAS